MTNSIRILCFDDNKNFRDSVELLLATTANIKLAATFDTCEGIIEIVNALNPDVILMDIDMPPVNGIEAVRSLRTVFPDLPVLMLTGLEDAEKVFASILAGANGYILKNIKMDSLIRNIEEVYHGGAPMTPLIARKVLTEFAKKISGRLTDEDYNLSNREKEVLQYLVQGKSYKMIAGELNISYETVHSHIRRIYKKLQVNSVGEAISKTFTQKILK